MRYLPVLFAIFLTACGPYDYDPQAIWKEHPEWGKICKYDEVEENGACRKMTTEEMKAHACAMSIFAPLETGKDEFIEAECAD